MGRRGWATALALAALPFPYAGSTAAAQATDGGAAYWVYVANESSDLISRVRFSDGVAVEEKTVEVGYHPTDLDGAHGLIVSPDGAHWYVSIAHGQPYGQVWKMESGSDRLVDSTTVGLFPATLALTPDGAMLYAVNFNLHGDPVPSTVSPVFTPVMHPLEQIETCVRPHGSRVSRDGARHYSGCLLSDQLVEISTDGLRVTRRLRLTHGAELRAVRGAHSNVPHAFQTTASQRAVHGLAASSRKLARKLSSAVAMAACASNAKL